MAVRNPRRSGRRRASVVGTSLVVALLGLSTTLPAPAAHADAVDSQFLNALQAHNINFGSPNAAILAAHQVCNELDAGRQKADVANEVTSSSNLDGYHAGYFVGVSIAAYCPRHHLT